MIEELNISLYCNFCNSNTQVRLRITRGYHCYEKKNIYILKVAGSLWSDLHSPLTGLCCCSLVSLLAVLLEQKQTSQKDTITVRVNAILFCLKMFKKNILAKYKLTKRLPIFFFCWRPADSVMVSFFFSTSDQTAENEWISQSKNKLFLIHSEWCVWV